MEIQYSHTLHFTVVFYQTHFAPSCHLIKPLDPCFSLDKNCEAQSFLVKWHIPKLDLELKKPKNSKPHSAHYFGKQKVIYSSE